MIWYIVRGAAHAQILEIVCQFVKVCHNTIYIVLRLYLFVRNLLQQLYFGIGSNCVPLGVRINCFTNCATAIAKIVNIYFIDIL